MKSLTLFANRNQMTRYILRLSVLSIMLMPTVGNAQAQVTVIRGGTLIDATGAPPRQNAVVVVRGDRIESIGSAQTRIPAGATVLDATGKYILPGLVDTHLHYKDWFPELMISNGVTSVLGYGGGPWLNLQKEGIEKGKILGPRIFLSQGMIGSIYMGSNNMVDDPEVARKQVQGLIQSGSTIIKVYSSVTPSILRAVADEAHQAGLKVSGHIGISARDAAIAGLDNLAHATGLALAVVDQDYLRRISDVRVVDTGRLRVAPPKIATWNESRLWGPNIDLVEYPLFIEDPRRLMMFGMMDRARAQELIDLLVREEVYIESCLGYTFRDVNDHTEEWEAEDHRMLNDPNLHYMHPRIRMNILDYSMLEKLTPDELALMKKGYRNFQWFTKTFVDAGGKVDVGVDTSSVFHATMTPGVATRREMQLLVDAGLSNMQAIQAATLWPAEVIQKTEEIGTVEAGKFADLLVLPRDPLQDITAFKDVEKVMKGGRFMELGYHYDFQNPIPNPAGNILYFRDWGPVSEIPTRITGVSPKVVVEGDDSFTLAVRGHEFISSSVVRFGQTWLPTELVNENELRATVPAKLVRTVGTYPVTVVHRPPGWGTTNTDYVFVKFR